MVDVQSILFFTVRNWWPKGVEMKTNVNWKDVKKKIMIYDYPNPNQTQIPWNNPKKLGSEIRESGDPRKDWDGLDQSNGLVFLFNGLSSFMGYLMPKPSFRRRVLVLFNP